MRVKPDHASSVTTAAVLVGYNLLTNRRKARQDRYVARNVATGAILVGFARHCGLTWRDIGFDRTRLRHALGLGLSTAGVVLAAVPVGTAIAAHSSLGGRLLNDRRAAIGPSARWGQFLVRIPIGTAAFEEVAFRGVLHGMIADRSGPWAGAVGSSLAFGLWHIGPTLAALRVNDVDTGRLPACTAAVAVTSLAGGVLAGLRFASGHVAGPWLAHWAVNAAALAAASRWQRMMAPSEAVDMGAVVPRFDERGAVGR